MMSSDSQAMGRVGEVIMRTWQTAHKMKTQRGSLKEDSNRNDNFRAKRYRYSLTKLVTDLNIADDALLHLLQGQPEVALPTALAYAAVALAVPHDAALLGMLFSWAENQVLVCVKSVPLGQVASQRLLLSLRPELEAASVLAQQLADDEICNWSPGLSLLSMQHEIQYNRLYRS